MRRLSSVIGVPLCSGHSDKTSASLQPKGTFTLETLWDVSMAQGGFVSHLTPIHYSKQTKGLELLSNFCFVVNVPQG